MTIFYNRSVASTLNSTTTPLNNGATFTGTGELTGLVDILVTVLTDQNGILYVDLSPNGTNWDSTITFYVDANLSETHRVVKGYRYYRIRMTNNSGANQTFLRLHTSMGGFGQLNTAANSQIREDADAMLVRNIDAEIDIAADRFQGYSIVNKFGTNSDVDSGSVPEDIWEGGGTYTGFPASGEALRAVSSSSSDANGGVGAEKLQVQAMTTDYAWVTVTFTLNGTTAVAPDAPYAATSFIRCHTATVIQSANGANTATNVGTITVRHVTTTTNIFATVPIGRNQSNVSAYTIPAGHTGYMRFVHCAIRGTSQLTQSQAVEGNIWTRAFGRPFRSRRPFIVTSSYRLVDTIYGGLVFTEKSDLILRITTSSANDVSVNGGYDLLLVKNL